MKIIIAWIAGGILVIPLFIMGVVIHVLEIGYDWIDETMDNIWGWANK